MNTKEQYLVLIRDRFTNKLGFDAVYSDEQEALEVAEEVDGLVVPVKRPAND